MVSIDPNGVPEISLRQLRFFMVIKKHKSVTKAASELNRSQTAITKALSDLEKNLGVNLFDRTTTGMITSAYGETFAIRIERTIEEFNHAKEDFSNFSKQTLRIENNPIFSMDVSYKRLSAFIALYQCLTIQGAAEQLNVTKAAIYSSVRQLEVWLGIFLFETDSLGVSPTPYCKLLAQRLKLAFSEIRHAIDDIANINGITQGTVKIGSLPYTRTFITPQTINLLLNEYQGLKVGTQEGSYRLMEVALRSGDIDFIIGAVRPVENSKDIRTVILFEDKLSVIARSGHPLMDSKGLSLSDLSDFTWVLPELHTPSGKMFIDVMAKHYISMPKRAIHTSSLSMVRGLLMESDHVALLSEHQIYYDKSHGLLNVLPVDMVDSYRPIGITMRRQTKPSLAAKLFLDKLQGVVESIDTRKCFGNLFISDKWKG